MAAKDFFVSYTQADLDQAKWIVNTLEAAGYSAIVQYRDFRAGKDVFEQMRRAKGRTRRTLALVSKAYMKSEYARREFNAASQTDVVGTRGKLIPVVIEDCQPSTLCGSLAWVDLFACKTPEEKKRRLLEEFPPKLLEPAAAADLGRLTFDRKLDGTGDELFSVAFSRQQRWVAAGSNGKVLLWHRADPLWHSADPLHPRELEGPESYVYSVAFSRDCRYLAGGSEDHAVRVWDLETGELLWKPGRDGTPIQRHGDAVYSVAFSPDGNHVVSGGYDGKVYTWDTASGDRLLDGQAFGVMGRVSSVAVASNGDHVAVGSLDNKVRLWNPKSGTLRVLDEHQSSVEAVAFSPDGRRLASCGLDKSVRVWDVASGKQLWCGDKQHEYLVRSVAFSPDGRTVASASWDKTLRLWDADTGKPLRVLPFNTDLPWHSDWIWSVAFDPDGTMFATGGSDGEILIWNIQPLAR